MGKLGKDRGRYQYHVRSKVFVNFMGSYLGIVLLVVGLLGMLAMKYMMDNMLKEENRLMQNKLKQVAEDLEIQYEAMREMTVEITSRQEFDSTLFGRAKYREIEMLNYLGSYKQFAGGLGLFENYFVKYAGKKTVYHSNETTSFAEVYFENLFGEGEGARVSALLHTLSVEPVDKVSFYRKGSNALFIYPMKKYANSGIGREGVLCFVLTGDKLEKWVKNQLGSVSGSVAVYYGEECLLDQRPERTAGQIVGHTEPDQMWDLEEKGENGHFTIRYWKGEGEGFLLRKMFSPKDVGILCGAILVLLLLGFVMAYRNYLPFHRIVSRYVSVGDDRLGFTWESLEGLLESLCQGRETDSRQIKIFHHRLREYIMRLVVTGGYTDEAAHYVSLFNIAPEGSLYGLLRCTPPDPQIRDCFEQAKQELEALPEGDCIVYDHEGALYVMVAVSEEEQLREFKELIQEVLDTQAEGLRAELLCSSDSLKDLCMPKEEGAETDEDESFSQNVVVWNAVKYIREHYTDYDISLDQVAEELDVTATYLSRIFKQEVTVTYKEFLTDLRMREAKRLLLETDMSVVDICKQIGYSHVSYFIKLFQKCVGDTPAKYRAGGGK